MARMRADERRRQLLEAAAEVFASRGYRGATTAELARAAGITEPILYRHFDNKLDLFITLVDVVGDEVIAGWNKSLNGTDDPHERLRVLLASNPATHERGRRVYRVIFQAMTEVEAEPSIAAGLRRHLTKLHGFVREELATLQSAGVVRQDEPPEAIAWLLVDAAIGHGITRPLSFSGRTRTSKAETQKLLADLITRGETVTRRK